MTVDIIERLIAENERLREGRDTMGNLWARAKEEIAELRAENERLRAVLKQLVYLSDGVWYTGVHGGTDVTDIVGPVLSGTEKS